MDFSLFFFFLLLNLATVLLLPSRHLEGKTNIYSRVPRTEQVPVGPKTWQGELVEVTARGAFWGV